VLREVEVDWEGSAVRGMEIECSNSGLRLERTHFMMGRCKDAVQGNARHGGCAFCLFV
jgi:hypothetical protein